MTTKHKNHFYFVVLLSFLTTAVLAVLGLGLTLDPNQKTIETPNKKAYPLNAIFFSHESLPESHRQTPWLAQKKPLVVNFWASWCRSCEQEAPHLKKLWEDNEK